MDKILAFMRTYFDWFYITTPDISDIIEILILSYVIYKILMWFKSNRAWTLLKGIVLILLFTILASLFQFNTILYILKNVFSIGILAVIILFQPEFRRGLETLGRKKFFDYIMHEDADERKLSDKTIYELIKTVTVLSANRTGALIVIEDKVALGEYIDTGIPVDAVVTNQLLLNIFEPFEQSELIRKVKALIRRYNVYKGREDNADGILRVGTISIDPYKRVVTKEDEVIHLTDKEFALLFFLVKNRGRSWNLDELYENIWQEKYLPSSSNTVMVHVLRLRQKIEENPAQPEIIRTIYGKGYQVD